MKNPISPMHMCLIVSLSVGVLAAGCGRDDTRTYKVAKEQPPQMQTGQMPAGHPDTAATTQPHLTWKTPEGWTEGAPSEFRLASFNIKGDGGKQANVSVIPLPGQAGGDLANVNRWRVDQLGLQPATADELAKLAQPVEVAGQSAALYDVAGKNTGSGEPTRILGVIQHRGGTAWFFKMTGDDELVAQQKPAFVEFLKSVKFEAGEMAAFPAGHPPMDGGTWPAGHPPVESGAMPAGHPPVQGDNLPAGHPEITATPASASETKSSEGVPAGWKEMPAGQFLVAKFGIAGDGGAQATVNVSVSGGGLLMNANRWRTQLGQGPLTQSGLDKLATSLDTASGKAVVVELSGKDASSGQDAKLIGAVVSRGDQALFFKLMGNPKLVEAQKDTFMKFVQTSKY